MKGEITVDGAAAASSGGGDDHGGPLPAGDVAADPNAPAYELYDATAPALLPGTVHDIDLVITEEEKTVADGFVQKVWTFGGTVPGPVIRVKVGDTIRVHLKNPAENQLSHSIDFHASQVAWNDEMTSIAPGEEKLYEWTADYAGVWMYHCGTAPGAPPHRQRHVRHGHRRAEGGPAEGRPRVRVRPERVVPRPAGQGGRPREGDGRRPAPDFVVFNGVANQYKDHPLEVGDRRDASGCSSSTPARASTARSTSSARSSTRSSRKA